MKRRTFIVAASLAAFLCTGISSLQAQSSGSHPILGMWKLNLQKSSYEPGPGPRGILRAFFEGEDGFVTSIRITENGQGIPDFAMVRMKIDGQDHEVWTAGGLNEFLASGTRPPATASFAAVDAGTLRLTQKNNGEVGALSPNTWAVSSDGSTLTVSTSGTRADGVSVNNVEVYDRVNPEDS